MGRCRSITKISPPCDASFIFWPACGTNITRSIVVLPDRSAIELAPAGNTAPSSPGQSRSCPSLSRIRACRCGCSITNGSSRRCVLPTNQEGCVTVSVQECEGSESRFQIDISRGRGAVSPSTSSPEFICRDRVWAAIVCGDLPATRAVQLGLAAAEDIRSRANARCLQHWAGSILPRIFLIVDAGLIANDHS